NNVLIPTPAAGVCKPPLSSAGCSLGVCAHQRDLPAPELCPQLHLCLPKSARRDHFPCNAPQPRTRRVWRLGPNSWGGAVECVEVSGKTPMCSSDCAGSRRSGKRIQERAGSCGAHLPRRSPLPAGDHAE
ncbi:hypothetical protein H8957_017772, partial [Semnopithecus entellus]